MHEASFSTANNVAYSMAGTWPFGGREVGGLGLRMSGFGTFGDGLNMDLSVAQSTVTDQSGTGVARDRLVSTITHNYLRMKGSGAQDDSSEAKVEAESSSKIANNATEQHVSAEPPKDYIHIRARRGQATDSHSLAERVMLDARREKISERMKILQDLVPGCNKVIGKALVLDEIINYIQSLQRQVELDQVNSRMNRSIESFPPKELTTLAFDATTMMFGSQTPR